MGGCGTMVYALNHPEKFAVAASLSFPLHDPKAGLLIKNPPPLVATPPHLAQFRPDRRENQIKNWGGIEAYLKSPANTWDKLIENYEKGVDMPKLYFCCGTDDFLYEGFKIFRSFCEEQGYSDIVFEEEPGHGHEWRFWDMYIERIIDRYISDGQKPVSF